MLHDLRQGAPAFLASVTDAGEAEIALAGGATVIDAKDPARGALGALGHGNVKAIVAAAGTRAPVSATLGDLPSDPVLMTQAAVALSGTGVNLVKVGFFGDGPHNAAIVALSRANLERSRLVGVLMGDCNPDFGLIDKMARAGFAGVMLDTADKSRGALPDVLGAARMAEFIALVRQRGMFAGLAGSLRVSDICPLAELKPDVLGFRGALCAQGRASDLDPARVAAVKAALSAALSSHARGRPESGAERSVA